MQICKSFFLTVVKVLRLEAKRLKPRMVEWNELTAIARLLVSCV